MPQRNMLHITKILRFLFVWRYQYCGIIGIRGGSFFVVFVGSRASLTNLHPQWKLIIKHIVYIPKLKTDASTKLHPRKSAKTPQSTKIGPHEIKWFQSSFSSNFFLFFNNCYKHLIFQVHYTVFSWKKMGNIYMYCRSTYFCLVKISLF